MSEDVQTRIIIRKAVDKIFDAALQPMQKAEQSREEFMAACMEYGKTEEECLHAWEEQQRQQQAEEQEPTQKQKIDELFKAFEFAEETDMTAEDIQGNDPISKALREKKRQGRI